MAERPPAPRRWSSTNSRTLMKAYDHSPVQSPSKTPATLSRSNSTASISSTKSEPVWHSQRHHSEPSLNTGDFNELRHRRESTASQKSAQPTAPPKKSGFMTFFSHEKDPAKEKEKERKRRERDLKYKEQQRIALGSKYAAAVRTKMLMDPSYREHLQKHKKPKVKTAAIKGEGLGAPSAAALQEMRYPHSGPPAVHRGGRDIPMLTRIESHDEPDTEIDRWEQTRREWNDTKEHNMGDIPEIRSRQGSSATSPWASPMASREPSPNRLGARPGLGSKRNSYVGGYTKDATTGRWTRKTPPSHTPTTAPNGAVNPDLLAASLAERLNAAV